MSFEKVGVAAESDCASAELMQIIASKLVSIVAGAFRVEDSNLVIWNSFKQVYELIYVDMNIGIAMTAIKFEGGNVIDAL